MHMDARRHLHTCVCACMTHTHLCTKQSHANTLTHIHVHHIRSHVHIHTHADVLYFKPWLLPRSGCSPVRCLRETTLLSISLLFLSGTLASSLALLTLGITFSTHLAESQIKRMTQDFLLP